MTAWPKWDEHPDFLKDIPPVPSVVRYYDDFSDSYGEVLGAGASEQWVVFFDGQQVTFDFSRFDVRIRQLIMSWCATVLAELSPRSVKIYHYGLAKLEAHQICSVVSSKPQEIRALWREFHAEGRGPDVFSALHSLIYFCCEYSIGLWAPEWASFLAQLPLPKVDKYASVRTGSAFLDVLEEQILVSHLEGVCAAILTEPDIVNDDLVKSAAILACSYQLGLRAKQIAMLKVRDIRIWTDDIHPNPAVHLTFLMIKQRSGRAFPIVRRMKREWSPIFTELLRRALRHGLEAADHILANTPKGVSRMLASLTESILKRPRTVMDLRHTAAQRLVDAGANEEELAAYLGHSDLNTGLMYFRSSQSQAERVNRALGVSEIYQKVVKIAHDRFISASDLSGLKGDQQIAGAPHGMPIAGIGGCSTGQPNCPYNPVLSCYGCNRFMPIADPRVHERVLQDLREVLKVFYVASRGERGSPALQMERTISYVQAVIDELGPHNNELLP